MKPKYDCYTWEQFEADCLKLAEWARELGVKGVYGIPRGGLPLAVKLSHLLDVPLIMSIQDITPETLVVDDIIDTGKSLERLFAMVPRGKIASLYVGKTPCVQPDFSIYTKEKWIVFPWETSETS